MTGQRSTDVLGLFPRQGTYRPRKRNHVTRQSQLAPTLRDPNSNEKFIITTLTELAPPLKLPSAKLAPRHLARPLATSQLRSCPPPHFPTMFRSAVLRSASAARAAIRPAVAAQRTVFAAAPRASVMPKIQSFQAVRMYSAGGALNKDEVEGRIVSLLQGFDKVNDIANIKGTAHFANDLGLDSLDTVEVVMAIEEEFSIEIPDKDADAIHSVEHAVEYILKQPDAN